MSDTLMCVKGSETKDKITDSFDNESPCKITSRSQVLLNIVGYNPLWVGHLALLLI